eukprot:350689-Chlamydomonas_euryale.AAC.5
MKGARAVCAIAKHTTPSNHASSTNALGPKAPRALPLPIAPALCSTARYTPRQSAVLATKALLSFQPQYSIGPWAERCMRP